MKALLIGCGAMGLRHAQALRNENIEISTVVDLSQEALQNGIDKNLFTADSAFSNPDEAFANVAVDIAVISTTAPYHHEYLQRSANSGIKFILCEKPLAPSIRQCEEMLKTCKEQSIACAVNHQRRFIGQYMRVNELATQDQLGELTSFQVSAGNFGIAMNGSHYIEIASYLFGEEFEEVTAWLNDDELPNPRGEQFKDFSGCIRAITASGKRFYLDASGDQGHGLSITIAGRNGQIQIDDLEGRIRINRRKSDQVSMATTRYAMPWQTSDEIFSVDAIAVTQKVIRALLNGDNYPTLYDGLHTVKVLVAAHLSNEQGNSSITLTEAAEHRDRVFPWA